MRFSGIFCEFLQKSGKNWEKLLSFINILLKTVFFKKKKIEFLAEN
jgi:hypothetical protein